MGIASDESGLLSVNYRAAGATPRAAEMKKATIRKNRRPEGKERRQLDRAFALVRISRPGSSLVKLSLHLVAMAFRLGHSLDYKQVPLTPRKADRPFGPRKPEKQVTGDRGQGTGNREQGTGDRGKRTGDRGQGTEDRGQGTGDRGQSPRSNFVSCFLSPASCLLFIPESTQMLLPSRQAVRREPSRCALA